jgi:peptidyl-prolyl cis-trans isomerase D
MSSTFRQKTSSFFVTAFIGFIIISFMFTGYETMRGTPDTVASVNGENIRFRQYQNEYNRQLEFYRQFTGDNLTSQQIEQFGIKDSTINNLVTGELLGQFANSLGAVPGHAEISKEIKALPYFQTNGQFDIERYKSLLQANGMSPADFEADIKNNLQREKAQVFFNSYPISQSYLDEVQQYKAQRKKAQVVRINKESLRTKLKVTKNEISTFLQKDSNKNRVNSIFEERRPQLDRPEQVKVSHILLAAGPEDSQDLLKQASDIRSKLTPSNFAKMANKHTQDPSGQGKGGEIGWVSADGQMTPDFEKAALELKKGEISKPIETEFGVHLIYAQDKRAERIAKFQDYQDQIATELIQRNKSEELVELIGQVKKDVEQALKSWNVSKLDTLQKRYGFNMDKNTEVNLFDGNTGEINIPSAQVREVYKNKFHEFEDQNSWLLTATQDMAAPTQKELDQDLEALQENLSSILSRKLQEELVQNLRDQGSIKVYSNRVR